MVEARGSARPPRQRRENVIDLRPRSTVLDDPAVKLFNKSVGPALEKLGLANGSDLIHYYPFRYIEVTELTKLDELPMNEMVTLVAEVAEAKTRYLKGNQFSGKNRRPNEMMNVVVTDGTSQLHLTFFAKVSYHKRQLEPGVRALFHGKVTDFRGTRQLAQPKYDLLGDALDDDLTEELRRERSRPIPVYRGGSGLDSAAIRAGVRLVLDTMGMQPDPLPIELRARMRLMDMNSALQAIHRPLDLAEAREAKRRLRFEEAFVLQVALANRRRAERELAATPRHPAPGGLMEALDQRLPFTLTAGQQEVSEQILQDIGNIYPMHRLLQGEVGSGKTVVALRAMLAVIDSGGQAALLAPTEVLAAQHFRSITAMLGDLGMGGMLGGDDRGTRITLLTGSQSAADRRKALLAAASGEAGIVVGTHALLGDKVQFADLGLIVVDEQHRFGVEQRDVLRGKAKTVPHLLVMTATPIPRTVAMTIFGDLETSTLIELPAGRSPIASSVVPATNARWVNRMWERVREEVTAGHQVFVVCPRIGLDDPDVPAPPAHPGSPARAGLSAISLEPLDEWDDGSWDDDPADRDDPADDDDGDGSAAGAGDGGDGEGKKKAPPARAVMDELAKIRALPQLAGLVIEPLHGKMPADERDETMRRFAAGEVHVLVATTVIEVGVDVPNASTMVVLDADRFGVSQLHQLRGRVGRGTAPGLCLLVTGIKDGPVHERLQAVAATLDGFELAKIDLENRREGDVLGKNQSGGRSSLTILKVLRDEKTIVAARHEAIALVEADPGLRGQPALRNALRMYLDEGQEIYLERG